MDGQNTPVIGGQGHCLFQVDHWATRGCQGECESEYWEKRV